MSHKIILVSDATGETAAQMVSAAMVQFSDKTDVTISRTKNVRTEKQIDAILEEAAPENALIIFTLVSPDNRTYLLQKAREKSIPTIDLIGPLLYGMASYFGYKPKFIAGLLHDMNERYFRRIEAMEFTIAHDDGRDLSGLEKADLVILGISRTSKTPLSMYLSHQGWRVANIPLIEGFQIPDEIAAVDPRKVVCLTIDTDHLSRIRRSRLERLGHDKGGEYADPMKVQREVEYATELYKKNRKWAVFNVTGKALEETASEIIRLMSSRALLPSHSLEGGSAGGDLAKNAAVVAAEIAKIELPSDDIEKKHLKIKKLESKPTSTRRKK